MIIDLNKIGTITPKGCHDFVKKNDIPSGFDGGLIFIYNPVICFDTVSGRRTVNTPPSGLKLRKVSE